MKLRRSDLLLVPAVIGGGFVAVVLLRLVWDQLVTPAWGWIVQGLTTSLVCQSIVIAIGVAFFIAWWHGENTDDTGKWIPREKRKRKAKNSGEVVETEEPVVTRIPAETRSYMLRIYPKDVPIPRPDSGPNSIPPNDDVRKASY